MYFLEEFLSFLVAISRRFCQSYAKLIVPGLSPSICSSPSFEGTLQYCACAVICVYSLNVRIRILRIRFERFLIIEICRIDVLIRLLTSELPRHPQRYSIRSTLGAAWIRYIWMTACSAAAQFLRLEITLLPTSIIRSCRKYRARFRRTSRLILLIRVKDWRIDIIS